MGASFIGREAVLPLFLWLAMAHLASVGQSAKSVSGLS